METATDEFKPLVKKFVEVKKDQLKLYLAEKMSAVLALLIAGFFLLILLTGALLFSSLLFARLVNNWLESNWPGYLVVAFLYAGAAIVTWRYRFRLLQLPILNAFLQIFDKYDENKVQ